MSGYGNGADLARVGFPERTQVTIEYPQARRDTCICCHSTLTGMMLTAEHSFLPNT